MSGYISVAGKWFDQWDITWGKKQPGTEFVMFVPEPNGHTKTTSSNRLIYFFILSFIILMIISRLAKHFGLPIEYKLGKKLNIIDGLWYRMAIDVNKNEIEIA